MKPVPYLWTPVEELPDDTSALASADLRALAPLWTEQLARLRSSRALRDFNERFHRRWAIETGLIERLYQFDRGITEVLVARGFDAALIPHGASDKSPEHVARVLNDQREAVEGLFDFVKQNRPLSTSYSNELHAVLTANQTSTEAITPDGRRVEIELLRGAYKQQPNNPRRPDGQMHEFAPPEHVASEMDRLVALHADYEARGVAPEVLAAWAHHAFTQIHPYQDGNGRVARALASLIFLRAEWFPLLITNDQRDVYIGALEQADHGDLKPLVDMFARAQQGAFRSALSVAEEVQGQERRVGAEIAALRDALVQRRDNQRDEWKEAQTLARTLREATLARFQAVADDLGHQLGDLALPGQEPYRFFADGDDDRAERARWHWTQTIETAKRFDYFANLGEFAIWARLGFETGGRSELLVSFHALGREYQGVLLATACYYRRDETEDHARAIADITPMTDEPFQILYTDAEGPLKERFSLWLDAALVNALDAFRRGL